MTTHDSQRVVPLEAIFDCPDCHGAGYEVEQVCCGKMGEQCCGDPDVRQVPCASCVTVARDVLARLRYDSETLQRFIVLHPDARESMQADADAAKSALSASPPVAPVVGDGDRAPVENPDFWIGVVRTNAYTTDCADKTLALTNAADALARIFAHRRLSDRRTFEYAATLREEIRDLKKAASAPRAAAQEGVRVVAWRMLTSRGTVINGWIDGEPTAHDRAFSAEQNRTIELAYSHPPAQMQGVDE